MTSRENALAVLNYENYEKMPVVSFGYWHETLDKWALDGHVTKEDAEDYRINGDNGPADRKIMDMLGFDFNWNNGFEANTSLFPVFEKKVLEERPDGSKVIIDSVGLKVLIKPGIVSIPAEIGTCLTGRDAWEKDYLPRMQWSQERIDFKKLCELPPPEDREIPIAVHCGSLMGTMRNLLGVEEFSYLYVDDEDLFIEIADTFAHLSYQAVKTILESGTKFDYAHYWEDICYKNGPLINPKVFDKLIGPNYKKTTELLSSYGVNLVSLDCDGWIDSLIPTWINNGVNTMFPIEVGTWDASIAPWREKYGRELRGVGGMNKVVFAHDYAAIDAEIERLKPLIDLGGFIPCPDHRIAPDAKFENVQYYCERLRAITRA